MSPRPKALLFTHSYWPEHSPPQRRWVTFNRALEEQGWQVDVISPAVTETAWRGCWKTEPGPSGERIHHVAPGIPGAHRLTKLLSQCVSAGFSVMRGVLMPRPQVVIVTVPSLPIAVTGFLIARWFRVPLIVDMRDAWPDLARDSRIVKGNAKSVVERIVHGIQTKADLVLTVTNGFAQVLRQRGLSNVETIPNSVDVSAFHEVGEVEDKPRSAHTRFRVLYLGNHGESQRLEIPIRAAALVGESMELILVGSGVRKPALKRLARRLNAPVTFRDPVFGPEAVREIYRSADSCIISLRDDWKSFETTIPSKTYEVLMMDRHITAIVRGEAAQIVRQAGVGDVVAANPVAVAKLWQKLSAQGVELPVRSSGHNWVAENADSNKLSLKLVKLVEELANDKA